MRRLNYVISSFGDLQIVALEILRRNENIIEEIPVEISVRQRIVAEVLQVKST
jgi:hypothetical protein